MKELDFQPKKTTSQFLDNYKKHDEAGRIVRAFFENHHIKVIDYGEDRRNENVWERGKDRPDAIIWNPQIQLAFIDWKGHNDHRWLLNQRAYNSYLAFSEKYGIPIFVLWVYIPDGTIYYAKLPFKDLKVDFLRHDDNRTVSAGLRDVLGINTLLKELSFFKQLVLLDGIKI